MGPNVKKLIVRKMAHDAIPSGGGLAAGVKFLSTKEAVMNGFRVAAKWVEEAIAVVKTAPDNPYQSDEEIAAAILLKLESK